MIKIWRWDGKEIGQKSTIPDLILDFYHRGKIFTITNRKTGEVTMNVLTKYGEMKAYSTSYIIIKKNGELLILNEEDYKIISQREFHFVLG